jgi:hypothetical protein
MFSLIGDATKDILNLIYREVCKKHNKKKISLIIGTLSELLIIRIQPFMYTIMAILIILFLMNCFQFYYYIKLTSILSNDNFPHSAL